MTQKPHTLSVRRRPGVVCLLLLAIASALHAPAQQAASKSDNPEEEDARGLRTREFLGLGRIPDPKMAAEGAKIFGANCGFCHGANARGASGPDLLRSQVVLDDNQGELVSATVHNGRPGKGMPAFPSLTPDQLRDIAEFLHLQVELAANRGTYKTLNIVTGNAQAGEAYFKGEGKCATCHSATGDLAHIGSQKSPADIQQAFLYPPTPQGANHTVTVTLADGAKLQGTLKHLDDFYVSLVDQQGAYHTVEVQSGIKVQVDDPRLVHRQMLDHYTNLQMHDLTAYLVTLK